MSIINFPISPFIDGRRTTIGGGQQNINATSTFNVSTVVTGNPDHVGFCIQGNPNGLDGTTDDVMRLWIDNIRTTQGFALNPTGTLLLRPLNDDITMLGTSIGAMVLNLTGGTITAVSNINSNNDLSLTADDNITLLSNSLGNINLDAPNINSYTNALPICFDFVELDRNYNYTSGGQLWELAWTQNLNVPSQFFVDTPQMGYTSNKWKIDFSLNTWSTSNTNSSDKALAYYFDFQDQNGNTYSTPIFNKDKPYCLHNNNSTWNQGNPLQQFIPFSWTDIVDFTPLGGTGSSNTPLKFNLYISADNPRGFDFNYKLGLTRTNLL